MKMRLGGIKLHDVKNTQTKNEEISCHILYICTRVKKVNNVVKHVQL